MADFITIIPQSTFNDTQKLLKDVNAIADAVERVNEEAKKIKFPSEARNVIKKTNEEIKKTDDLIKNTEKTREKQRLDVLKLQKAREKAFDDFEKQIQREKSLREAQVKRQSDFSDRLSKQRSREEKQVQQQIEREKKAREKQVLAESNLRERLAQQRERQETQQKKLELQNQKLSRSFVQLNKRRTEAADRLRDLIASERASNREIQRAQREFDRLNVKVQRANRAVRDFTPNVGNYRSALSGAVNITRQLVGAFGAIEAGRFLINFTRDSIALAREARGVEFAFNRIANSAEILTRTREATRGLISDLEIQRAAVQLANFNLNVEDLDTLLQLATIRATQTGQGFEKLVDQIVLGLGRESAQRLDDLGVSQSRINAEVDKGKDFVQAFVDIAREEIPKAGAVLDEAANGAQAFSAAVNNLQVEFGRLFQGGGAFGIFTRQIQRITDGIKLLNIAFNTVRNAIRQIAQDFPIFQRVVDATARLVQIFTTPGITFFAVFLRTIAANLAGVSAAVRVVIDDLTNLGRALLLLTINPLKNAARFRDVFKSIRQTVFNATDAFNDAYNKALENTSKRTAEVVTNTKTFNKEVKDTTKTTKEATDELKKLNDAFNDFQGEGISAKQIVDELTFGWEEYQALKNDEQIEKEREALKKLEEATQDFLNTFSQGFFREAGLSGLSQFFDFDEEGLSTFDKLLKGVEGFGRKAAVTFTALTEVAQDAFSFIEQSQAASIQKQLDDLNTQKEIALALNEGNAEAIAAINEQAAAQEAEIKQKQAEQNKQNALFNIAINTAQGVVAALASVPPNVPLSIAIGAIGALQAALVSAQPIPQFKDGVENFKGGLAVVGDGGVPEVISTPDKGMFVTPDKPTLVNLPKGSDVIPNLREFDLNLNRILLNSRIEPIKKKDNSITADQMNAIFARNMRKMTALNLNMDQNGFALSVQRGLSKTNIERNRVIFKGQKV